MELPAITSTALAVMAALAVAGAWAQDSSWPDYPQAIRTVLANTRELDRPPGRRLPLLLWPVHGGTVPDAGLQERIVRDLAARGLAMIATWDPGRRDGSLAAALQIARIQQRLGLRVCVNANACMYGFFDGAPATAHVDADGSPFFDPSFPKHPIGCAFRIDHRYDDMRERIDWFVRAYRDAGVPLDFVFGDWEIDGPLDVNRAWEAARRCVVDREHVPDIDDSFDAFQSAVRVKRAEATRVCYTEPILSRYPDALVGNYAVYPHDGFRYWFDYFEQFVEEHPHRLDQRAPCRRWYPEFDLTGYTFAMPVVYPWARLFHWYDHPAADYRWFYNMLRVASNAGRHTAGRVPVIPFVHWHRVFVPDPEDAGVLQMSEWAYQELLWHMLLRGTDTFFLWCRSSEAAKETALLHGVWAAALAHADWLDRGTPVNHDVPRAQGPVVSGLRIDDRVLVRRTDFDEDHPEPVTLTVRGRKLTIPRAPQRCAVLTLE